MLLAPRLHLSGPRVPVLIVLALLCLCPPLSDGSQSSACYSEGADPVCDCSWDNDDNLVADCSSNGLTAIPEEPFPVQTAIINFKNNLVTNLASYSFPDLSILTSLNFGYNTIEAIEPNAFRGLFAMEGLSLTQNMLRRINATMFSDLLLLKFLDLSSSNIEYLSHNAFHYMTNLTLLNLAKNYLVCDCEVYHFRTWVKETPSLQVYWPRCKNYDDTYLDMVPDEFFQNCSQPLPQSCIKCTASSTEDCFQEGTLEECTPNENSCLLTVDVISGSQTVTSKCAESELCRQKIISNEYSCQNGEMNQQCDFCCTGYNCTTNISLSGYEYGIQVFIQFELILPYKEAFGNTSSQEYQDLALEITTKVELSLSDVKDLTTSSPVFLRTRDNYTFCRMESNSTWPMADNLDTIRQSIHYELDQSIRNGTLGLNISEESLRVTVPDYCPPDEEITNKGEFHWPNTKAGVTAVIPCPFPNVANGQATRECYTLSGTSGFAVWNTSDQSACAVPSPVTEQLKNLLEAPVTNETVGNITEILSSLTTNKLTSTDLQYVSQQLEKIVTASVILDVPSADNMMGTYDNVIVTDQGTLGEAQRNFGAIQRSLLALDVLAVSMPEAPTDGTLTKPQVALGVLKSPGQAQGGAVFTIDDSEQQTFQDGQINLEVGQSETNPSDLEAAVYIPESVLMKIGDQINTLQFVGFSDDKLFKALAVPSSSNESQEANSRIVAATFGGVHLMNLSEPVTITFSHDSQEASDPTCAFWDFEANAHGGAWSSRGCRVIEHVDEKYTVCECDHLTNFALLMDIYGTAANLSEPHQKALTAISYVGCSISIICLVMTLTTYLVFSKLRKDNPSKLLMNLCSALLMVMILFIIVTVPSVRGHEKTCQAMAGLLHYFLLATWVWMAVEAFYMYLTLIKIFNTYMRRFLLKCSLVGWGVPAVIVIITVSIGTDNYGLQGEICWLETNAFYGACMAPILLIMAGNFVVFGLVIHQIRSLNARSAEQAMKNRGVRTQLRGAFAVVVLLGLTWIFSIFAIGGAGVAFHYLFTIFNSFQGLFIFVFYCLLKKDVKETWREKWSEITSTTALTSSERGTNRSLSSSGSHANRNSNVLVPSEDIVTSVSQSRDSWPEEDSTSSRRKSKPPNMSKESLTVTYFEEVAVEVQEVNLTVQEA